jgi:hypothetical protein
MTDEPRTDWLYFSLGELWALEKDGGLLVPKGGPVTPARAERIISYAARGLGIPGFCIETHFSGVWEMFAGNGVLRLLLGHCEKMRVEERRTINECMAFKRSRLSVCLFNPPAAALYRKTFWGARDD